MRDLLRLRVIMPFLIVALPWYALCYARNGRAFFHEFFWKHHVLRVTSPELAHYDTLARTGQQWRNLEGYYTRYGDVRELLEKIDDRIVIAGSGDELRMRFPAPPPPQAGWTRDFIFIGDGWMKEGDYNFKFSKTVLPLPRHSMRTYTVPLLPLEQDQTYLLQPSDWQRFHTRYVTPEPFARALWNRD